MDYKKYFTTDNKSGWKSKESVLRKLEPKIYSEVRQFVVTNSLTDLPFKQQIWHFIYNETTVKKCLNCDNQVKFKDSLTKGYNQFCSLSCANESGLLQVKASNVLTKRYGVKYFTQHQSFRSKVLKTKLDRYGNENYNNIEKCLETKEKIHGSKTFNNKDKNKITTRDNLLLRLSSKTNDILVKYDTDDDNITFKCSDCNRDYEIYNSLFNYRSSINIKPCTICNPVKDTNSIQEKELFNYIQGLLPNEAIEIKTKKIITPFELDIYIPSRKLAIEFNGLYWHSDEYLDKNYHLNKTLACEKRGVQLIHIFEDEWVFKKDIIKSIIKSKLGFSNDKVFARKCEVRPVDLTETRTFLNTNHIQGFVNSKIQLGLYKEDQLVSLLTLGGLRKALGNNTRDGTYELLRFANKLNTIVIGGFSKLLKYFIKNHPAKSILTFSDNRFFTGDIYKNNGFSFVSNTAPNYFYIIKHKRENRFKYRKDVLVREGYAKDKSEREIMLERKIYRIYDSGNKKWLLSI